MTALAPRQRIEPARRSRASGYDQSRYEIFIQDGGERRRLPDGYMSLITGVALEQVWDGADQLQIEFEAQDDDRTHRVLGERILAPGTSLIFRAGYGKSLHTMGRFTIGQHEPIFTTDGPSITIIGTDGFRRMMDDSWPAILLDAKRWDQAGLILARKYHYGFVGDVSDLIPHKMRSRRVRTGKKRGRTSRDVKTEVIKSAGDTDAAMIKHMAGYAEFMSPKVRFIEANSNLARQIARDYPLVEAVDGRDVLFFRRMDIHRQIRESGSFIFRYSRKDGLPATLTEFAPALDTDQVPTAVRVSGIIGHGRKREVVTVEAELVGPEQYRRRSDLLLRAARTTDPARKRELESEAEGLSGEVEITRVIRSTATKADRKTYANGEATLIEVQSNERQAGLEIDYSANDRRRKRKVQTMRRETLRYSFIMAHVDDLGRLAESWLLTRLQLRQVATASAMEIPGLELVYPQQVHEVAGTSPEYDGLWMPMKCTHTWGGDGHQLSMAMERIAESPSRIKTNARRTESAT